LVRRIPDEKSAKAKRERKLIRKGGGDVKREETAKVKGRLVA